LNLNNLKRKIMAKELQYLADHDGRYQDAQRLGAHNGNPFEVSPARGSASYASVMILLLLALIAILLTIDILLRGL
jgi:hypothetical protein